MKYILDTIRRTCKTKMIMRFVRHCCSIMILAACLQVSAKGFSQQIVLNLKNVSIHQALTAVGGQSNYRVLYSDDLLPAKNISINAYNEPLDKVMNDILDGTNLQYKIQGNKIIIFQKSVSNKTDAPVNQTITGRVTDTAGNPLSGVSIQVKGTNKGTMTNMQGNFSIDIPDNENNATLVFFYVGYQVQEIPVTGGGSIAVTLRPQGGDLNDVVVVGYGTQKKVNLTGAVAVVGEKDLADRPVTNLTNALEGTAPGVTVVQSNGQPGMDGGTINIRGVGTMNNSNPMIVVDGNIVQSMNDVNPNDIASISVLKDAASAAIYGSRAANGVLLITTKKGKVGKPTVTYNDYFGKQKATTLPDYLPSWQAATLYNEALGNEGKALQYTDAQIDSFKLGNSPYNYPNTNWLGLFYSGSGFQQSHDLSVSGGTENTKYYFSFGYFDQDGITPKTNTQRYSTRFNITTKISDRISVFANLSYTYQPVLQPQSSFPGSPQFSQMIRQINRISPIIPYKYANGYYGYISDGSPMAWLNSPSFDKPNSTHYQGIAGADIEIVKNLHIRPQLAYAVAETDDQNFIASIQYYSPQGTPTFLQGPNSASETYAKTTYFTPQVLADYSYDLKQNHFKIMGGYSQELDNYHELYGYRQNLLNNELSVIGLGSTTGQASNGDAWQLALRSFFGRFNYNYKEKYLFEANLRYDGSSRFAPGNQYGTFPSLSAGWRISEEDFFKPLKKVVNDLKLRASWGKLGNQVTVDQQQNVVYYPSTTTISGGQTYVFGGISPTAVTGVSPMIGVDQNVQWEETTESDFGLDANFLNNSLTLTADYFIKNTNKILYPLPISATYGMEYNPIVNAAAMRNQGLELALSYHNNPNSGGLKYAITGNVSFIKNKITSLAGTGTTYPTNQTIMQVGLPFYAYYGFVAEGLFKTQQQLDSHASQTGISPTTSLGDLMYKDLNGDGVINQSDKTYLGTNFPKVTYGLNINLSYRHFDLTAFFQGAAGVKNFIQGDILGGNGNTTAKPTAALWNSWTPTNNSNWPRAWINYLQNAPSNNPSSFWIKSADYMRMKNLQVGYSLPDSWAKKIHVQRLRIYYSGQNLFTLTSFYKWVDPEQPSGAAGFDYPQVKINTIGLNLSF